MRAAVGAAREHFGALHGGRHAAGDLAPDNFRPVVELGREACGRQFAAKVYGLIALEEALRGQRVACCMLTSSLSSVLGGVGYAAYAGANAFMDAFAAHETRKGEQVWVSVDWDRWDFAGRAPSGGRDAGPGGSILKPEEGLAVFERILRLRGLDRVVVSTGSLVGRLERWVGQSAASATPTARPRPLQSGAYVAPRSETERVLAGVWQELLGIGEVGIHDNFFELGGHSLFAARLLSRVRAALGVSLPLEAIFEGPTIAELAVRVAVATGTKPPALGAEAAGDRVEIEM